MRVRKGRRGRNRERAAVERQVGKGRRCRSGVRVEEGVRRTSRLGGGGCEG